MFAAPWSFNGNKRVAKVELALASANSCDTASSPRRITNANKWLAFNWQQVVQTAPHDVGLADGSVAATY